MCSTAAHLHANERQKPGSQVNLRSAFLAAEGDPARANIFKMAALYLSKNNTLRGFIVTT
jgi:hypothetical protein